MKIRFECRTGCTKCCEERGFVYLTEDDIERLATYLGMARTEFEASYVYRTKNLRRLRVPSDVNCSFLRDGGCSVHAAKPVQCASFPYWPEILETPRSWREAGRRCPGIGKGELVNIEMARATAAEMSAAHSALYT